MPSSSLILNWVPGSLSTVQCSAGPYSIYRSPYFRLSWNRVKWVGLLDNPRSLPLIFLLFLSFFALGDVWSSTSSTQVTRLIISLKKKKSAVDTFLNRKVDCLQDFWDKSNIVKPILVGKLLLNISLNPQWWAHVSGGGGMLLECDKHAMKCHQ